MALTLTAGAPPIFLSKNYFNTDAQLRGGTFTATTNSGIAPRVLDMDPFAYWLSAGSSDGVAEIIISQLYEGYSIATRSIGFFALLNTNAKNFTIDYSINGGTTWVNLVTVVGNAAQDYLYDCSAAPIANVNAMRVSITTTFAITDSATNTTRAAGGDKQIGTICAHSVLWQMTRPPDSLVRRYPDNIQIVLLADKSEDVTYFKRSAASHEFYACDMTFSYVSMSERDTLRYIRRTSPNFCLMPEPGDRLGDLFYGRFVNDWRDSPMPGTAYKGAGNMIPISFKETTS